MLNPEPTYLITTLIPLLLLLRHFSSARLCTTLWTAACQAPLSTARAAGVSCHGLFRRIFPTQGSNPGLLHCRQSLLLSHQGSLQHPLQEGIFKHYCGEGIFILRVQMNKNIYMLRVKKN